jgi:hypothetical protein
MAQDGCSNFNHRIHIPVSKKEKDRKNVTYLSLRILPLSFTQTLMELVPYPHSKSRKAGKYNLNSRGLVST